jgi:hypothetical protein
MPSRQSLSEPRHRRDSVRLRYPHIEHHSSNIESTRIASSLLISSKYNPPPPPQAPLVRPLRHHALLVPRGESAMQQGRRARIVPLASRARTLPSFLWRVTQVNSLSHRDNVTDYTIAPHTLEQHHISLPSPGTYNDGQAGAATCAVCPAGSRCPAPYGNHHLLSAACCLLSAVCCLQYAICSLQFAVCMSHMRFALLAAAAPPLKVSTLMNCTRYMVS